MEGCVARRGGNGIQEIGPQYCVEGGGVGGSGGGGQAEGWGSTV